MATSTALPPDLESHTTTLRTTMRDFCQHFIIGSPPPTLLDHVFTASANNPRILEHGPSWATPTLPFLNQTFSGRGDAAGTCDDYFRVLGATLQFLPDEHTIPAPGEFVIDAVNGVGVVKARCKLASVRTGMGWEEQFIFMFSEFDAEGRIGRLEIWSDGLSAWNAVTESSLENGR